MPRWPDRQPIGDRSDPRSFEVLIARYLEWRDVRNYSQRSRSSCESNVRMFGRWCLERGLVRPVEVTRPVVERYQRWLYHYRRPNGRALAVQTQIGRLRYVQGFFKWLIRERYLLSNPASDLVMPKVPVRLPAQPFTLEEVEQVLAVPDVEMPIGLRDRVILEMLYSTGIRRAEIAKLDLYDIDAERGYVTVRSGKGDKDRVVPIGERALAWLDRYLEDVRPALVLRPDEWALFLTADGVRFNPDSLGNKVRKMIERSGVRPRIGSCHLFRHTMATLMLENGADIRYLQEMLGHAKVTTTQVYTKVSIEHLKKIHEMTHPARLERTKTDADELASGTDRDRDPGELLGPTDGPKPKKRFRQWRPERLRRPDA